MIRAVPFIFTIGSENFKEFLARPFTVDMLYPIFNVSSSETLFEHWIGKDMLGWHKFTNQQNITLEFYADHYDISKKESSSKTIKYRLGHLPKSLNQFINDMERYGVELYWSQWVEENFEPKDLLHKDDIKSYYKDLLNKLDKGFELQ